MEHPYEGTVSKLRFCESFQKNTSLFKTYKIYSLARTDSLLPAFLLKEDACSLKLRFQSISKPNNFRLLRSHFFRSLYWVKHCHFCIQKRTSNIYFGLISCYYFQCIQYPGSYRVLDFLLKNLSPRRKDKKLGHLQNYTNQKTKNERIV